jgi:CRP/FNR family transcriptional regulator, cyclic AMP receptor protein
MDGDRSTTVGSLIASRGHRRAVPAGATIFMEGDRSHSVFACLEGRVRIFVNLPSGRELVMGVKLPGQEFGELSAIDERPRSASAAALEPSVVAQMSGVEFIDELVHTPPLAALLLRSLADQLRRANARLCARNSDTTAVRAGHMILELAGLTARHGDPGELISLPITQLDLAEWIGATRESTARALAGFRAAGVLDTSRGRIVIRDLAALAELVRSS